MTVSRCFLCPLGRSYWNWRSE